jgi:ribosomal 50S subunit-recycling heat shock protein
MRLDKYLKVSRLVKRRTVAAELCQGGHVKINGQTAKPSAEVKPGNLLQLRFGNRLLTVKVVQVPEKAVPAQLADTLYETLEETALESQL